MAARRALDDALMFINDDTKQFFGMSAFAERDITMYDGRYAFVSGLNSVEEITYFLDTLLNPASEYLKGIAKLKNTETLYKIGTASRKRVFQHYIQQAKENQGTEA